MKRIALASSFIISLSLLVAPSYGATTKPGSSCTKVKSVSSYKGKKVVCTQYKGKRIWVAVSNSKTASPSAKPSTTPTTANPTYTSAQVAERNSKSSCWTIVDGKVYNVTEWISAHPGGPDRILRLCGVDGTAMFRGQHRSTVDRILSGFYIGDLAR